MHESLTKLSEEEKFDFWITQMFHAGARDYVNSQANVSDGKALLLVELIQYLS
jgi:hypothetical protein